MPNLLRSIKLSATLTALFLSLAGFLFYQTYLHYQNFSNLIHHPHIAYRPSKSVNWAGYATATNLAKPQAGSVSDVRASWIIPNLTCDQRSTYSAIWVGIDGYRSSTVEQIGTESDCSHGQHKHSAWFEIFPHAVQSLDLPVQAGDRISAEVKYLGSDRFSFSIQNGSSHFQTTQSVRAERSSAEWIVEAPSLYFFVLPLANFGTTHIINASATINGHTGSPSDHAWQSDRLTMVNTLGAVKAVLSLIDSYNSFSVTWNHR